MQIMRTIKIKINREDLKEIIERECKNAEGSQLSGWHIPIYVHAGGRLEAGSWLSNNSWQPDAITVVSIDPWNIEDIDDSIDGEDWTKDDAIDFAISETLVDWYLNKAEALELEMVDDFGNNICPFEIV